MRPTIGRIVIYTLTDDDVKRINSRRADASSGGAGGARTGYVVHSGNQVEVGDAYPMIITRVWGTSPDSAVNGQVLLDGNDTLWATSVSEGEGPHTYAWPVRA
jgi:hypothetical protein